MLAERLTAQLLAGAGVGTPEEVASRLLAIQGQDPRGARLAVRSRTSGVVAADVDAGLSDRRSLVVTWLNRGTLHLVGADDYWWLHPLTAPQMGTANARRLSEEGVTSAQAERAVELMTEQTATLGPRTRAELQSALVAAGLPAAGPALTHMLFAASLQGLIVRGPMRGAQHCYVAVADWLGESPEPLARPDALALLARRYLAGHGPAGPADLAKWAGIGLRDARLGLALIDDELIDFGDGLVDLAGREPPAPMPGPRLLGSYDPLLHGWVSRRAIVGDHATIVTDNGLFRQFALLDGRAVATWGLDGGQITIRLLEPIGRAAIGALEDDAVGVLRYLGLPDRPAVVERA